MIIGAVGIQGSGKSYGLQRLVAAELRRARPAWRFLVLDQHSEWPGEPARGEPRLRFLLARTPGEAARALASGERAVIVRPGLGVVADPKADRAFADRLAHIAIAYREPVMLVLPEAHRYLEEHRPSPPHLRTILHQSRHARTGLLWDTQQVADIRKEVLKETIRLNIHAQVHPASLDRLRREYGERARVLALEAARRLRRGEPGWHIEWHAGLAEADFRLVRR